MECHEEAVSSQATQLTATVVGVAMCTLAGEHKPRNCADDADQPFQVEGREDAAKQLTSSRTHLTQTRLCDTRREESATLQMTQTEMDLRCRGAWRRRTEAQEGQ